jgi:uncharacterized protein (DUF1015 family)
LSLLISPPYDVISPQERERLHRQSPYSFVRLVLGEELPGDNDSSNRFTRAGEYLRDWLRQGILIQDPAPAIYRLKVDYEIPEGRRSLEGITLLARLHPYDEGIILPHEKTLQGPKEGLRRLMLETGCNLDSVWMLYEDNGGHVREALSAANWTPAAPAAQDSSGVRYSLEACASPEVIAAVREAFAEEQLIIADGHHRYETALELAREMGGGTVPAGPWGQVMVTACWTDHPGLTVLPTHRVVRGIPQDLVDGLQEALAGRFSVRQCAPENLKEALDSAPSSAFACVEKDRSWLAVPQWPVDATGAELLQQVVLAERFGFDIARLKTDPRIAYVEHADTAIEMVQQGDYQAAFLLKPIPVRTITRYAREGRCLPQKSTYFYPKLASGLVLRRIEEDVPVDG